MRYAANGDLRLREERRGEEPSCEKGKRTHNESLEMEGSRTGKRFFFVETEIILLTVLVKHLRDRHNFTLCGCSGFKRRSKSHNASQMFVLHLHLL